MDALLSHDLALYPMHGYSLDEEQYFQHIPFVSDEHGVGDMIPVSLPEVDSVSRQSLTSRHSWVSPMSNAQGGSAGRNRLGYVQKNQMDIGHGEGLGSGCLIDYDDTKNYIGKTDDAHATWSFGPGSHHTDSSSETSQTKRVHPSPESRARSRGSVDISAKSLKCHSPDCVNKGDFRRKSDLRRHLREQHQLKRFSCTLCKFQSKRGYLLKQHVSMRHAFDALV